MKEQMAELREDRRQCSDRELLGAIAARDGHAFAVFYRRHLAAVIAFLMRETRDREVAADLAAEVFAAVLVAAGRYHPQGDSAAPWVLGIARNKLLMSRRRGRVEARARAALGFEAVALHEQDLQEIDALAEEGAGQLVELLESLPEHERDAIRSRVLEERSYGEIAGELECSEMVVRKRVSRGLHRLRRQVNGT